MRLFICGSITILATAVLATSLTHQNGDYLQNMLSNVVHLRKTSIGLSRVNIAERKQSDANNVYLNSGPFEFSFFSEGAPHNSMQRPSVLASSFVKSEKFRSEAYTRRLDVTQQGVSMIDHENLPLQYTALVYIVVHLFFAGATLPFGIAGLKRAKGNAAEFIKASTFVILFFLSLGVGTNVVVLPPYLNLVVAACIAFLIYPFAMHRMSELKVTYWTDIAELPLGWIIDSCFWGMALGTLIYKMVNFLCPYQYGLASIVTGDENYAVAYYIVFCIVVLVAVAYGAGQFMSQPLVHNVWMTFTCSYVIIADIAYIINIISLVCNIDAYLIAYDPIAFFSVRPYFAWNLPTSLMTLALIGLWLIGIQLHIQEDAKAGIVPKKESPSWKFFSPPPPLEG